jgi:sugar lactone lactonase YvrE
MTKNKLACIAIAALAVAACGKKDKDDAGKTKANTPAAGAKTSGGAKSPTGATPNIGSKKPEGPTLVSGFKTPESVLYDADADVYLISNINGDPFGADDNGFIARVAADGGKMDNWIDGAKPEVTLDAPKGMALLGDLLYVADITVVRMFDRKTGAPKGEVAIKGATFLNDLAAGPDAVYVSDSGLSPGFKPSGSDAIYKIAGGKATPVIKAKDLGNPNGLAMAGADLWVVTFGSGELYKVAGGKKMPPVKPPKGQLDGLIALEGGDLLISSWEGKVVYRGPADGSKWTEVAKDLESPADLGWDGKRNRMLVPLFQKDQVAYIDVK